MLDGSDTTMNESLLYSKLNSYVPLLSLVSHHRMSYLLLNQLPLTLPISNNFPPPLTLHSYYTIPIVLATDDTNYPSSSVQEFFLTTRILDDYSYHLIEFAMKHHLYLSDGSQQKSDSALLKVLVHVQNETSLLLKYPNSFDSSHKLLSTSLAI